jgi:flagellar hook-basal body complex protein FliE
MPAIGALPPYSGNTIAVGPELQAHNSAPKQSSFLTELQSFVGKVDELEKNSEQLTTDFAQGRQNDIHGTMIAATQAGITVHLLGSIRNRVLEAYREVMRMGA